MEIIFFGQLTDITNTPSIIMEGIVDIDQLKIVLFEKFPELKYSKFVIAVNNKITRDNKAILPNSKIAIMPPFSGG